MRKNTQWHTKLSLAEWILLTMVIVGSCATFWIIFLPHDSPLQTTQSVNLLSGDFNQNGSIDRGDINSFLLALNKPEQYLSEHPNLNLADLLTLGDLNNDGVFNDLDAGSMKILVSASQEIKSKQQVTMQSPLASTQSPLPETEADLASASVDKSDIAASNLTDSVDDTSSVTENLDQPAFTNGKTSVAGGKSSTTGSAWIKPPAGATGGGKVTISGGGGGGGGGSSLSTGGGGGGSSRGGGGSGGGGGGGTTKTGEDDSSSDTTTKISSVDGTSTVASTGNLSLADLGMEAGPTGITAPGATTAVRLAMTTTKHTPQISAISEITYPGETLVITGAYLRGARLGMWVDGKRFDISPLRSADDRMLAILPNRLMGGYGDTIAHATTLVWPIRDREVGLPIRVNAATAWWAWPCRVFSNDTAQPLRVFGKNLEVGSGNPILVIQGQGQSPRVLSVIKKNPYSLEAMLPADLPYGRYKVWAHNGTGGKFGWSEVVWFEVVKPVATGDGEYEVDDYIDDDHDASAAIELAIKDAVAAGGGVVKFSSRSYDLTKPIVLPKTAKIILRGAGMGEYDPDTGTFTGPGTLLRETNDDTFNVMIDMQGRGDVVEDLTVSYSHETANFNFGIRLNNQDQTVARARVISKGNGESTCIGASGSRGNSNNKITDCDIHTRRMGILVSDGTHFVQVVDNNIRGYFSSGKGLNADAIINMGSSQFIVENNEVQSHDRAGGEVLSRTCLIYNNSIRNCYLAGNRSTYMGPLPSVDGMARNAGEQYLFHLRGEIDGKMQGGGKGGGGGKYAITSASSQTVKLNSHAPPETKYHENDWVIFIASGKGAGQFRVISDIQGRDLELARPWRVIPAQNSVAIIQRMFRQNIVYNNYVNAAPDPGLVNSRYKTSGVFWYHVSFDNITAGNVFKNVAQGVSIATDVTTPSAWNVTRDNEITAMVGWAGDCALKPMFYSEHNRGKTDNNRMQRLQYWCSVGNVFRGNNCTGADAAAQIGWLRFKEVKDQNYIPSASSGMAMSVVENNRFMDVDEGILISAPANWTMIRGNTMDIKSFKAERVEVHKPEKVIGAYLPGKFNASYD